MSTTNRCPKCETELPPDITPDMCPKCLMGAALDALSSAVGQALPDEQHIDDTIETDQSLDAPTLPPRGQGREAKSSADDATLPPSVANTDGASEADEATLPPDCPIRDAPPVGTTVRYFGDYELLEEIARGGMGVVYKARQVKLNRTVALKMILAGQLASEDDVRRFYTEAEAVANLDHSGIVPIYEVGEHEGQHYFSMGFVDGQSLADRLKDGPLPPREAAELTKKVAEAVAYAHKHGVIHRDLKPANILLERHEQKNASGASTFDLGLADLRPKITDFGLAKKLEGDSNLTGTGQILGTPSYMPPEQAAGKTDEIGPAADIYSLGAILYSLLTGRPPFQAATLIDTLKQVIDQEPVSPRQLNPAVSRDLETICLTCLEKDPCRRYGSAGELADELQRFLNGEPIQARPIGSLDRAVRWCKRKPVVAGLSAAVILSLVVGTCVSTILAFKAANEAIEANRQREAADEQREAADEQREHAEIQRGRAERQLLRSEWLLYANQIAFACGATSGATGRAGETCPRAIAR